MPRSEENLWEENQNSTFRTQGLTTELLLKLFSMHFDHLFQNFTIILWLLKFWNSVIVFLNK